MSEAQDLNFNWEPTAFWVKVGNYRCIVGRQGPQFTWTAYKSNGLGPPKQLGFGYNATETDAKAAAQKAVEKGIADAT